MANVSKRTPQKTKQLIALYKENKSAREIGAVLGVSHQTVTRWLEEQGLTSAGKAGRPSAEDAVASRRKKVEVAELVAEGERELTAPIAGAKLGVPAGEVLSPYEHAKARAIQFRETMDANFDAMLAGAFPTSVWERLAKLETDYLERVEMLAPKETYDPAKDEEARAAAAKFDQNLAKQITQAEGKVLCVNCARPAFVRALA